MVLYFSGTGNSRLVAERLAASLNDNCMNLFDRIRNKDFSLIESAKPLVIVTPIYAYKMPTVVEQWLMQANIDGDKSVYFVHTCGAGICGAGYYNKRLSEQLHLDYKGTAAIIMPENYIVMFSAPGKEKANSIIDKALPSVDTVAERIKNKLSLPDKYDGKIKAAGSAIVNSFFCKKVIRDKAFKATDACVGCGKCAALCVKDNIKITNGKPSWQGDCTHCMACICGCPESAIEYGKSTRGKVRYQAPQ